MSSVNEWEALEHSAEMLERLGISHEAKVLSALTAPAQVIAYAETAQSRGLCCLIAASGGSSHLPGLLAAHTSLPVLAVPLPGKSLGGLDSLLAAVQMPPGAPVGTLAIGRAGAVNAALFAAAALAHHHANVRSALEQFRKHQTDQVLAHGDPRA
jgi:5-(carboxyamino)imidazole ribonucleotide mutase